MTNLIGSLHRFSDVAEANTPLTSHGVFLVDLTTGHTGEVTELGPDLSSMDGLMALAHHYFENRLESSAQRTLRDNS